MAIKFDKCSLKKARQWIADDIRSHLTDATTVEGVGNYIGLDTDESYELIMMLAKKIESPSLSLEEAYEKRYE